MGKEAVVLGAGIVGLSAALHLQLRGWQVLLLDRRGAGEETSSGNAGLVQREAVFPQPFPRDWKELLRYAGNRDPRARYRLSALPSMIAPFHQYWKNSEAGRYHAVARHYGALIRHCLEDHLSLAAVAGAEHLYHPGGWVQVFREGPRFHRESLQAAYRKLHFDVEYRLWEPDVLAARLPALRRGLAGAIHWTQPLSLQDPLALSRKYLDAFLHLGGRFQTGTLLSLVPGKPGWEIRTSAGKEVSPHVVLALGPWSADFTAPLGYRPPVFVKRGYHMHYARPEAPALECPVLDTEGGYVLAPMRQGIRLTTGAEFARRDDPPSPVPLDRAEAAARRFCPGLGARLDPAPWLGSRPCTADMLPVIGPLAAHSGLWLAFGHCHQGLTLGPGTGRLLAQLMEGESPFTGVHPYRPERFPVH